MKVDDKIEKSQKWLESPFCFRLMSWFFLVVGGLTAIGTLFGFVACVGGVSLLHNFDLQTSLMLGYTGSTLGLAFGILFGGGAAAALLIVMGIFGLSIVRGKESGMGKLKFIWFVSALLTIGAVVNVALALLKSRLGLIGLAEAALPFCMFMGANGEKKRRESMTMLGETESIAVELEPESEPVRPVHTKMVHQPVQKPTKAPVAVPQVEYEADEDIVEPNGPETPATDPALVPMQQEEPKPEVLTPEREEMADELETADAPDEIGLAILKAFSG